MDQTKFINSYINNLAEQLKASTLDNIMLKTQLAMANETVAELTAKIETLEKNIADNASAPAQEKKVKSNWDEGTFKKDE
jgi:cell division protein FtsB